jgi:integrase
MSGGAWIASYSEWRADETGKLAWKRTTKKLGEATGKERLTKQEAMQKLNDMVSKANGPNAVPKSMATVRQFVDVQFTPCHVALKRPKTRLHYKGMLENHILPTLGDVMLKDVDAPLVQRLISAKIEAGFSSQTVVHIRNIISAVFTHAKFAKAFSGDRPTEGVMLPELVHREIRTVTMDQVEQLADALRFVYRSLIRVLAMTGMRIGEALGLRWRDVNLEDTWAEGLPPNSIGIRRQFVLGEFAELKTSNGRREIPMTASLWVVLQMHREAAKFVAPDDPVFSNRAGQPLDGHNVAKRHLKKAAKSIGRPDISFHAFRHTYATLADRAGVTASEKQKILGHASESMGMRYTHADHEDVRKKMELVQ